MRSILEVRFQTPKGEAMTICPDMSGSSEEVRLWMSDRRTARLWREAGVTVHTWTVTPAMNSNSGE